MLILLDSLHLYNLHATFPLSACDKFCSRFCQIEHDKDLSETIALWYVLGLCTRQIHDFGLKTVCIQ